MPDKGKCWSCGKYRYLMGVNLRKDGEPGKIYYQRVCAECAIYFVRKGLERNHDGTQENP